MTAVYGGDTSWFQRMVQAASLVSMMEPPQKKRKTMPDPLVAVRLMMRELTTVLSTPPSPPRISHSEVWAAIAAYDERAKTVSSSRAAYQGRPAAPLDDTLPAYHDPTASIQRARVCGESWPHDNSTTSSAGTLQTTIFSPGPKESILSAPEDPALNILGRGAVDDNLQDTSGAYLADAVEENRAEEDVMMDDPQTLNSRPKLAIPNKLELKARELGEDGLPLVLHDPLALFAVHLRASSGNQANLTRQPPGPTELTPTSEQSRSRSSSVASDDTAIEFSEFDPSSFDFKSATLPPGLKWVAPHLRLAFREDREDE
ncbi:hypothetical protein J4E85_010990 [Alternaria conjuncta]|uniref:uncharacterized protein n=1 Tax=Alternaria conjuncta TaxID=181017 RepID=UPI002220DFFA|nr:uncharacterized protein J4E85_010990 [Alternaria conjuncta]KAI4913015.1 hypothetical protein J4E85_010990 [Alternaria conjuncta]